MYHTDWYLYCCKNIFVICNVVKLFLFRVRGGLVRVRVGLVRVRIMIILNTSHFSYQKKQLHLNKKIMKNKLKLGIFFFLKQINLLQNNSIKLILPQSIT